MARSAPQPHQCAHVFQQKACRVEHLFRDCLQTVPLVIVPGTSYEVAEWYNKWPTPLNAGGVVAELPPDFEHCRGDVRAIPQTSATSRTSLSTFFSEIVYKQRLLLMFTPRFTPCCAMRKVLSVHSLLQSVGLPCLATFPLDILRLCRRVGSSSRLPGHLPRRRGSSS